MPQVTSESRPKSRPTDSRSKHRRIASRLCTEPGPCARKLDEKIGRLEEEQPKLAEELAETKRPADEGLEGVTSEAVARHLAELVQAVTVEGPARARLRLDLPIRPLGRFDRTASKWCPVW